MAGRTVKCADCGIDTIVVAHNATRCSACQQLANKTAVRSGKSKYRASEKGKKHELAYGAEYRSRPEVKVANKQREDARYERLATLEGRLYLARKAAKYRSQKDGVVFDERLTVEYLLSICGDRCPVLGTLWDVALTEGEKKGARPAAPSLDRVDSSIGYVVGNVRVISHRANRIKNDATPDELRALAKYIDSHMKSQQFRATA